MLMLYRYCMMSLCDAACYDTLRRRRHTADTALPLCFCRYYFRHVD